jgi:site-specific DNA-methyltransferase (adenine-specific)
MLYVGDALDVLATIPPETVDCVWTDPPYKLSNDGITCVAGRMVSVNKGEWDRSEGLEVDHQFNHDWVAACRRVLKPTGTIWVSGTLHLYPSVGMALLENGFRLLNDIIWEKPNPPPNMGRRTFTHSTEVVLWASKAEKGSRYKYTFNYDAMRMENGGKQMKTVWRFTTAGKKEKQFGKHPTQKPIVLIDRCIRASTNPDDIVLDPFSGTASTGVAALGVGRRFIGIEVDESFTEIGEKRLSQITPPLRCVLGNTFIFTHRKPLLILQDCWRVGVRIWLGAILAQETLWSEWFSLRWKWADTGFGGA